MDHICVYQNIKYVLVLQRLLLCKRQKQQWGNGQLAIVMIMCVFSCLYETTRSDAVTHESNQIVVFFPSPHYIISQSLPLKPAAHLFLIKLHVKCSGLRVMRLLFRCHEATGHGSLLCISMNSFPSQAVAHCLHVSHAFVVPPVYHGIFI